VWRTKTAATGVRIKKTYHKDQSKGYQYTLNFRTAVIGGGVLKALYPDILMRTAERFSIRSPAKYRM
jgi:hypothetical protein